jgi:hypothetical protein
VQIAETTTPLIHLRSTLDSGGRVDTNRSKMTHISKQALVLGIALAASTAFAQTKHVKKQNHKKIRRIRKQNHNSIPKNEEWGNTATFIEQDNVLPKGTTDFLKTDFFYDNGSYDYHPYDIYGDDDYWDDDWGGDQGFSLDYGDYDYGSSYDQGFSQDYGDYDYGSLSYPMQNQSPGKLSSHRTSSGVKHGHHGQLPVLKHEMMFKEEKDQKVILKTE